MATKNNDNSLEIYSLAKNPLFLLVDEKNEKLYIVIDAEKWFFGQRYFGA
jgi:hypothetical protein